MKPPGTKWSRYLRLGLGHRLSQLGEWVGADWLIYNRFQFSFFHEAAQHNAPGVVAVITREFPEVRRWADVGCGTGVFAAEFRRRGVETIACEHNARGRALAARQGVDCRPFDLTQSPPADLGGTFDGAICFEVAEHLPPALGDRLVAFLASLAPLVLFTAAHPGQGGTGHINEQPKEYWIERFAANQMRADETKARRVIEGFEREKVPGKWFYENLIVLRNSART